jgi:hypothetical protein
MLPSQRSDLQEELNRLLEIAEYERVLLREEQDRVNEIIKLLKEENN